MNDRCPIVKMARLLSLAVLVFGIPVHLSAQQEMVKQFKISANTMRITLSRHLSAGAVDSFISKFNLGDIGLYRFMHHGKDDSLILTGWAVDLTDPVLYSFKKPLLIADPKTVFTPVPTPEDWRVVGDNRVIYGANQFEDGPGFKIKNGIVQFHLEGYEDAKQVRLAGNFTNWQFAAFPMRRDGNGWTVPVQLPPGQYYYKFIIDDDEWITDPANELSENDGRGNENSVFFVTNRSFELKGYPDADEVYLAGNFNNWAVKKLPLHQTKEGWRIDIYLEPGTWSYHFMVDGKAVPDKEQSKTSIGDPHLFILKGHEDAKKVILAGNFNDWNEDELRMKKTSDGWQIPYVLGPGNYQYKFIIDGDWMTDPDNTSIVSDGKGNMNSFFVIGANYTFRLKEYASARKVFIAGDFNNWSPEGVPMKRERDEWVSRIYLAQGKHLYKFLVDGKWILDPVNKAWEENEFGTGNSVLWVEPAMQNETKVKVKVNSKTKDKKENRNTNK